MQSQREALLNDLYVRANEIATRLATTVTSSSSEADGIRVARALALALADQVALLRESSEGQLAATPPRRAGLQRPSVPPQA